MAGRDKPRYCANCRAYFYLVKGLCDTCLELDEKQMFGEIVCESRIVRVHERALWCKLCPRWLRTTGSHFIDIHDLWSSNSSLTERLFAMGLPGGARLQPLAWRERQSKFAAENTKEWVRVHSAKYPEQLAAALVGQKKVIHLRPSILVLEQQQKLCAKSVRLKASATLKQRIAERVSDGRGWGKSLLTQCEQRTFDEGI